MTLDCLGDQDHIHYTVCMMKITLSTVNLVPLFRAIFKKRQNFSIGKPILLESSEAAVFDSKLFILAYYAKLKS